MHMLSKKRFWFRWNGDSAEIQEPHNGGNSQCIRSRSWSIRDGANTRWHASTSVTWNALRRTRIHSWVGHRSKATYDQRWEENHMQDWKFRTSFSLDCRQILVPVRPLHRYRRTRQAHLHVQQQNEVTSWHQETGTIHQKLKTKIRRGTSTGPRKPDCATFRNGQRSSKKIFKIQKCFHPHTFLMT